MRGCKKVIYKLCGKARWLLLAFVLTFGIYVLISVLCSNYPKLDGVRDNDDNFIHEYHLEEAARFSVREDGTMAIYSNGPMEGIISFIDIDSGEQGYSGIGLVPDDSDPAGAFYPGNFALTDSGDLYAVHYYRETDSSMLFTKETVVCLSSDYSLKDEICTFEPDPTERLRGTDLSRLHYYDGHVTFAQTDLSGVTLYSIDTETGIVTASNVYPTDPDGTYTSLVIPVDGSFLFLRSDGNVYNVAFNEPLGESIYHFDTNSRDTAPYFNEAVLADGKLYVANTAGPVTVYLIEDGEATKVFDLSGYAGQGGKLVGFDAYRPDGASGDSIVVCLENAFFTWSGGELTSRDILLKPHITPLMYLLKILKCLYIFPLIGLVINIIIRRKTLLYKQLVITIPVFVVLATVIAVRIYGYADNNKRTNIEKDVTIISELAADTFEGYDFSGLLETNEDTGAAYSDLTSKLDTLYSNRDNYWSEGYSFSVIYREDNDNAYVLAGNDCLTIPMQQKEELKEDFPSFGSSSPKVYLSNNLGSLTGDSDIYENTVVGYARIANTDPDGEFYVKVDPDIAVLYNDRSDIWFDIAIYSFLIICAFTLLLVLSTLLNIRVIKKATSAVKSISDGDLSARVNYKSKDELGQICSQVNEMAISLERSFEEKDRTEKFYYKFVPEKFREYLGKDSFTDLTLGDASSRELTVLFCDIRSFSINSEIMTAKENFSFVNTIYGKAGPIIREHNGFVDKYIGDAVMALFENADDAVSCGVDLYRAIVLDPATAKELNISDINIGIGIHTGMAMIGIVGESERLSGTVISDTVNLSSRLESLTKQYKTAMLISKDTVDRLSSPDDLDLRYLGMLQVAGVNEVRGVYEVLDCLREEDKKVRSDNSTEFREAVRLFQLGRRDDAVKALEKLAAEGRSDHVVDMYLEYIRSLSPDDKGNIFRFVRK
ncbi:MAG: adenylate/guanylate cyclase domain-containing protein [Clostridiales bacterium]|nr:adenylate/guanylate cyclase domain-containing protein [Clostridiales bacterium]